MTLSKRIGDERWRVEQACMVACGDYIVYSYLSHVTGETAGGGKGGGDEFGTSEERDDGSVDWFKKIQSIGTGH